MSVDPRALETRTISIFRYEKSGIVLVSDVFIYAAPSASRTFPLTRSLGISVPVHRFQALLGRLKDALPLIEDSVNQATSMDLMESQSLRISLLGEVHLLAGRNDKALDCAHSALNLTRDNGERGHEAWALRLLGEVHSHPDALDAEKAQDHYRKALSLAEELRMRPLIAHCHKELGSLYQKIGREEEACAMLTQAAEMYRAMEMIFFLNQVEEGKT